MKKIFSYRNGRLEQDEAAIVREFPLKLIVNDREIATLIASPHDLRFLVAGFLRLQGFVRTVDDFLILSVCNDFGIANVRIRGELPEKLRPVLTSGCGTGITFTIPGQESRIPSPESRVPNFHPSTIFTLMEQLARLADNYKSHGGIHSAAVGDGKSVVLYAEDLGRHNTLDRIAGEALLRGIDLAGMMLVTSGRVSTEMAAKATLLGITLIASRTSPTDMAVQMCEAAGITLIGYVRGARFNIYSHAENLELSIPDRRVSGVTGVILAGGSSSRMGSNKALLPYKGGRFIEAIYRQLAEIFPEVILVTNSPEQYQFLPCRKVTDLIPGAGALSGIHSGLYNSTTKHIFAVACDMPYLNSDLIRFVAERGGEGDVVIPLTDGGYEPLHAVYSQKCLTEIEKTVGNGGQKIMSFFNRVRVREISAEEVGRFDTDFISFRNINTPDDYYRMREGETGGAVPTAANVDDMAGSGG